VKILPRRSLPSQASSTTRQAARTTSAFRLAMLLAGLFTFASVVMAAAMYVGFTRESQTRLRNDIRTDALDLVALAKHQGLDTLRTEIDERVNLDAPLPRWYALYGFDGIQLAGNLNHQPLHLGWSEWTVMPRVTPIARQQQLTPHTLLLYALRTPQGALLVVGRDRFYIDQMQESAGKIFLSALLLIVLLSLLLGVLVGRRLLRRASEMSKVATIIRGGELSRRMPVGGSGDEFDHIAGTVNQMLDRIEALLAEVRRIGADIAHDLRTPLTRLRRKLEQARAHPPSGEQLEQTLDEALADIDELLNIFQALLRIARIESGEARDGFATVDLSTLLSELTEMYAVVAEDEAHDLQSDIASAIHVVGDRELLAQAFVNLIENAMRHTPAGGHITIGLQRRASHILAWVSDDGPGIPADQRENVLKPFHRLDCSRHMPGSGLGLALVRAIAELHNAELHLEDAGPGLRVTLEFAVQTESAKDMN